VVAVCLLALYCFTALPTRERERWTYVILFVLLWLAAHILFFGSARVRFPLHPVLIMSAVYGYHFLREAGTSSLPQRVIRGAVALLLLAGWVAEIWILASSSHPAV